MTRLHELVILFHQKITDIRIVAYHKNDDVFLLKKKLRITSSLFIKFKFLKTCKERLNSNRFQSEIILNRSV